MALTDCFAGTQDVVQKCKEQYALVVDLQVAKREDAEFDGIAFKVDVSGAGRQVTLTEERCFTLLFDDGNQYAVTVTHEASGFKGKVAGVAGTKDEAARADVELSKPWDLMILAKEKWPDSTEKALKKAKVQIRGKLQTAGDEGKIESRAQDLVKESTLKLVVKGLADKKCGVTVKTQLPKTGDGFLGQVEPTEKTEKGKNEIQVSSDQPGATVTVTYVMEVSVIEPKLDPDPIALVDRGDEARPTSLSALSFGLKETTHPKDDLTEIEAVLKFDDKIECYEDGKATKKHDSEASVKLKNPPLKRYVKGKKQGECKPTLKLSTQREEADRSWRIDPKKAEVEGSVWVEKLEIEAWKYRDGKDGGNDLKVTATPKKRELHNQNGAKVFTLAKLAVKKPSDEFWKRGGTVKLAPTSKVSLFKDATAKTSAPSELKQGDFTGSTYTIWAQGTGNADREKEVAFYWKKWKRSPEKVIHAQYVSCDAKVKTETLQNGDGVKLEAFAFDVHLDRKASNECRRRCYGAFNTSRYPDVIMQDVALAYAGGHEYYTKLSGAHVNKNYGLGGGSIFGAFIDSLKYSKPDMDTYEKRSASATRWVENHLLGYGIVLHDTMFDMIEDYIHWMLSKKSYFDFTRGVPGVHAEVLAVNEILNNAPGIQPEEITVATYRLQESGGGQGYRFVACVNCRGILLEGAKKVRVITG